MTLSLKKGRHVVYPRSVDRSSESSRAEGLHPFSGYFMGMSIRVVEHNMEPLVRIFFHPRVQRMQIVRMQFGNEFLELTKYLAPRSNLLLKEFGTLRPYREIERGVRVCRGPNFPYTIYYIIESSAIIIVAVKHDRRDPGYWSHRIR